MSVSVERSGNCLTITIDNPPVNALGQKVRAGLVAAVTKVDGDPSIETVILTGAGRFFSAGADITEFGKPIAGPSLPEVLERLEGCRVPIVAALPGAALGGGLEVALACRYRVASTAAKVGLPEVNLGLIPGAGGTQRLPRLVGMKHGAAFVSGGKPVGAHKAQELGIIDQLVEGDVVAAAVEFAASLKDQEIRPPLSQVGAPADWDQQWFDAFVAKTTRKARGQLSPLKALEAVEAACTLSFADGMARERALFMDCMASDQRGGLIHAFFAERKAGKIDFLAGAGLREVHEIGILGAGTMGTGIAIACASVGYQVRLFDIDAEARAAGMARIAKTFADNATSGRMSEAEAARGVENVRAVENLADLASADLIIEAIIERMDIKLAVFKELDGIAKPGAILASNTSYLDIDEIAAATKRPGDVIGMHFFSPANIMRLVEVVKTAAASPDVLATAFAVSKKLGKVAVLAGVCDGFIGNRILKPYRQQAEYLLEEGAMPEDIDRVMRGFGFAMGPFEVADLAGIDIGWHNRRREDATRPKDARYVDIADTLYEMGRLGQKTGAGWYDYKPGDRKPVISPIVTDLVIRASGDKGITRREIPDSEIEEKLITAMAREGEAILAEGIALKASDIDLVMIHGYGFPKYRGGLMYYAAQSR